MKNNLFFKDGAKVRTFSIQTTGDMLIIIKLTPTIIPDYTTH